MEQRFVEHQFGPNETIHGAIRLHNHQGMTEKMLMMLMNKYNELNNNQVPKQGDIVKIPVFVGFIGSGKK